MRKKLEKLLLDLGISEDFLANKEAEFDDNEVFEIYLESMFNQLSRR